MTGLDTGDWLRRNVWEAGPRRMLLVVVASAVLFYLLQNLAELALGPLARGLGLADRLEVIKAAQATRWVSPLLVAPILENAICWIWLRVLLPADRWAWWVGPLVVAIIAALFHAALYRELVYLSVVVNFFAICCLILNVRNRVLGFWASVLLHAMGNLLVLLGQHLFGF